MRRIPAAVLVLSFVPLVVGCAASRPAVVQFGEMRAVMREGQTEARSGVVEAVARDHAVGVGAMEGLAGEITIVDGEVWVSRAAGPDGTELRTTGPGPVAGDRASLLTLAHVERWQGVPIDAAAEGAELESVIERAAGEHGVDTSRPFPFMLVGRASGLDMHVINGYCPAAVDPATVGAQPWRWSGRGPVDVVVVGFFARDSGGVMTHHGTAVHAHGVVTEDGETITGHLDRIAAAPGMILRLPAAE